MFKVIYFIIFSIFFTNSLFAKPLPPGTGSTLPANILFMVDASQSMSNAANGGSTTDMRPPNEVVAIHGGNYIVSTIDEGGYYHWDANNNTKISIPTVFAGQTGRIHQRIEASKPVNMEYHAASKRIYSLLDHRSYSFGKERGGPDLSLIHI